MVFETLFLCFYLFLISVFEIKAKGAISRPFSSTLSDNLQLTTHNEQSCFSPNNFYFFVMCSICRFPKVWSFLRSRCPDDSNRKCQTFSPHSVAEYNRTRERIAAAKHFYFLRRAPFFSCSFSESELIVRHSGGAALFSKITSRKRISINRRKRQEPQKVLEACSLRRRQKPGLRKALSSKTKSKRISTRASAKACRLVVCSLLPTAADTHYDRVAARQPRTKSRILNKIWFLHSPVSDCNLDKTYFLKV